MLQLPQLSPRGKEACDTPPLPTPTGQTVDTQTHLTSGQRWPSMRMLTLTVFCRSDKNRRFLFMMTTVTTSLKTKSKHTQPSLTDAETEGEDRRAHCSASLVPRPGLPPAGLRWCWAAAGRGGGSLTTLCTWPGCGLSSPSSLPAAQTTAARAPGCLRTSEGRQGLRATGAAAVTMKLAPVICNPDASVRSTSCRWGRRDPEVWGWCSSLDQLSLAPSLVPGHACGPSALLSKRPQRAGEGEEGIPGYNQPFKWT